MLYRLRSFKKNARTIWRAFFSARGDDLNQTAFPMAADIACAHVMRDITK